MLRYPATVLPLKLNHSERRKGKMKNIYEAPVAEVISFTSLEQLASVDVNLNDLEGNLGIGSKDF